MKSNYYKGYLICETYDYDTDEPILVVFDDPEASGAYDRVVGKYYTKESAKCAIDRKVARRMTRITKALKCNGI